MQLLDFFAILCIGPLVGNEFAISMFVNPAIWKLDEVPQAKALQLLARSLGRVMPFWYVCGLLLLAAETYVRCGNGHTHLLYAAVSIWVLAIVYTVTLLVPINNRIAKLDVDAPSAGWGSEHHRWDRLHRWRVGMLTVALGCLLWTVISH